MKKIFIFISAFFISNDSKAAGLAILESNLLDKINRDELNWSDIIEFFLHLIKILIEVAGIMAVLLLMYGGFLTIISASIDDKETGKTLIKRTIGGFVIILLAWLMVDLLVSTMTEM